MKKIIIISLATLVLTTSCNSQSDENSGKNSVKLEENKTELPNTIKIEGVAQNPEGIEYDKNDNTFLLSSLNAGPIIKINPDGTYKPFTSGEPYPMSTAGLEIDYKNNRLLVAALNGIELYDNDPATKGMSNLRIYNLETGVMDKEINLSSLIPDAPAYMANDIALDNEGNIYITDWFAAVVYKVDKKGKPSVFWKNETGIASGANGIDFHPDGYLLVSLVAVNESNGLYMNYGLVKVPLNDPASANTVSIPSGYTGFDGMVITDKGNVIGITNNGKTPGGNTLIELSSKDNWKSAKVINSKELKPSTTVAITPDNLNYIINQDFSPQAATSKNWTIEKIKF